jgi:hypothetical protein
MFHTQQSEYESLHELRTALSYAKSFDLTVNYGTNNFEFLIKKTASHRYRLMVAL